MTKPKIISGYNFFFGLQSSILRGCFCCVALLYGIIPWQQANAQKKHPGYDFTFLQQNIKDWVDSGYYNGASIIIVKDDQKICEKYFGNYTPSTVEYIASAGKWIAVATIAAVVDEGKLNWDDKANKWLPELTGSKGEATLKQLLSHTAGYPDYQPENKPVDIYQTLKESVAHIVALPADTLAGTKFKYGGLAMQVAGRMAELATGKDWETIFQEKIGLALGMASTHFTPVDSSGGHAPLLGGGARTSLGDYSNFLSMLMQEGLYKGKRILSRASIHEMQADQVANAIVHPGEFVEKVRANQRKDIYGLGEWREEVNGQGEATLISSPSWAGAYPWIDKANNLFGFFLTHISNFKRGFNSFYASPVLPLLVRDAINDAGHPEVKRGFIALDCGKLFYEELGKGEPVIFIHGHSFDHYQWDPQFYEFAKNYRAIRYDVRGYGRSSMPAEFSSASHATDLIKMMDALKIKRAHLVGLSMGGYIATDMLALYHDRLLSVTLASGDVWNGSPGPSSPWTLELIRRRRKEIEDYKTNGAFNNKLEWFNALTTRNGKIIEQLRQPVWQMIYKWGAWQPLHVEPRFLLGTSVLKFLRKQQVTVPVMVLTGDADAHNTSVMPEFVPSVKTVILPNAGHVSNLENPAAFNKAVLQFISNSKN